MCLPWNHKWETLSTGKSRKYDEGANPKTDLPIKIFFNIEQQCKNCGKHIVRRYAI